MNSNWAIIAAAGIPSVIASVAGFFGWLNRKVLKRQGEPTNGISTAMQIELIAIRVDQIDQRLQKHIKETENGHSS